MPQCTPSTKIKKQKKKKSYDKELSFVPPQLVFVGSVGTRL
jgi:hypothetical protein